MKPEIIHLRHNGKRVTVKYTASDLGGWTCSIPEFPEIGLFLVSRLDQIAQVALNELKEV